MKTQLSDIYALAIRYFKGEILSEEEDVLFHFISSSYENQELFRKWEKSWKQWVREDKHFEAEWNKLHMRLQIRQSAESVFQPRRIQSRKFYIVAAVVACLLMIGGVTTLLLHRANTVSNHPYIVETANGEKSRIILTDGTVVWLNAGSSLQYTSSYNLKNREVYLQGEAYFEVTRQKENTPFLVKTDQYEVLVKGTKFNITSYPEETLVKTALLEGSVDILYRGKIISMIPGELISLNRKDRSFSRQRVQAFQYKSWTEGRLEYDKITLKELSDRLSRTYDVRIHVADNLDKEMTFRISLRNEETVGEILKALSEIIPIRYELQDGDIFICKQ